MRANTDWFKECQWGIFTHYLGQVGLSAAEWNARVDSVDVERLAEQVASVGARYYILTIGQGSGHYCAPNATYDAIVGQPGMCSRRDLVGDLADALAARDIHTLVYVPSDGSWGNQEAREKLGWKSHWQGAEWGSDITDDRLVDFQCRWEAIMRDWSLRWGTKVKGWWIDGCYFADAMYRFPDPPNFASFAAALKAGNPDALVAFNPGVNVPVISHWDGEEFTAGELAGDLPVGAFGFGTNEAYCNFGPNRRWVNGAQFHVLCFLGEWWLHGEPRFPDELVVGYTQYIIEHEGVITWDVPITPDGRIPEAFLRQLAKVGEAVG